MVALGGEVGIGDGGRGLVRRHAKTSQGWWEPGDATPCGRCGHPAYRRPGRLTAMRDAFSLDPAITHLNHGSFGAVPRVVAEHQRRVRDRAEANPMRFFRVESPGLKAEARAVAGAFLGVGADEVALVRNVTQATATVLSSLHEQGRLGPGDVIVLNEQGYESVKRAVAHWCGRTGASYQVVSFSLDADDEQVVQAYQHAFDAVAARGDRSGSWSPTTSPRRPAGAAGGRDLRRGPLRGCAVLRRRRPRARARRGPAGRERRGLLDRHLAQVGLRARAARACCGWPRPERDGDRAADHELEPRPCRSRCPSTPTAPTTTPCWFSPGRGRRLLARRRRAGDRRARPGPARHRCGGRRRRRTTDRAAARDRRACPPTRHPACGWSPCPTASPTTEDKADALYLRAQRRAGRGAGRGVRRPRLDPAQRRGYNEPADYEHLAAVLPARHRLGP